MKKMFLSAIALTALTTVTYAQDAVPAQITNKTPIVQAVAENKEPTATEVRTQIDAGALPAAVKAGTATEQYKNWAVTNAWQVKGKNEYYVIELQQGEEKTTLTLNKDGQTK